MRRKEADKTLLWLFGVLFCMLIVCFKETAYAQEKVSVENAKNGIVEIDSGLVDQNGKFYRVKYTSGCLISNQEGDTYILTTNHSIDISEKEKKQFCTDNQISTDNYGLNESIRIIVKGDVAAEASVEAQSETDDFCILKSDNVIKEKTALHLDSGVCDIGDTVYVLGFSEDAISNPYAQYDSAEVEIHEGTIQDTLAQSSEVAYLQHSGVVTTGNSGGPLLSEEGYIIGLNNAAKTDADIQAYFSLPIVKIKEVLDNFGICYESKERDLTSQKLRSTYEEYGELATQKKYKKSSVEDLQTALQNVSSVLAENTYDIEKLNDAQKKLENAKAQLVEKTPKTRVIIYILAAVIVILAIWLIQLVSFQKKNSFESISKRETEQCLEEIGDTLSQQQLHTMKEQDDKNESKQQKEDIDLKRKLVLAEQKEDRTVALSFYKPSQQQNQGLLEDEFQECAKKARMIQKRTGQIAFINKSEYMIGKNPEMVDYAILDNRTVSRIHAVVRWTKQGYCLFDLESANGTYVNANKVEKDGKLLVDGDEIVLANELFIFKEQE